MSISSIILMSCSTFNRKLDIFTCMLYLKFKIPVFELNILKIIFSIFETQIAIIKKKHLYFPYFSYSTHQNPLRHVAYPDFYKLKYQFQALHKVASQLTPVHLLLHFLLTIPYISHSCF